MENRVQKRGLVELALNPPHHQRIYAFLYLDPRVEAKLQIIDDFNTFAEIFDDLKLFERSLWNLNYHLEDSEMSIYTINGNGFLRKVK